MEKINLITKKNVVLTILFVIVVLAVAICYWYFWSFNDDKIFNDVMAETSKIKSYSQRVETETAMSGRQLKVIGDYIVNNSENRFQSRSTTILVLPENNLRYSFTYENISIENDIFLKVESADKELAIAKTDGWLRFAANDIPDGYANIAVAGPLMDNLRLFRKNGKFVKVLDAGEEPLNDEPMWRYTLSLSDKAFQKEGPDILGVLGERLGREGKIDIWIDKNTLKIRQIKMENYPYRSTTSISNINSAPLINPPSF